MLQAQETGDEDFEQALLQLDPGTQQRLRGLDLDMDLGLLEIVLGIELGLHARVPELEVAVELVSTGPVAITPEAIARAAIDSRRAAAVISLPRDLEDDWFGGYDENDPGTHPADLAPRQQTILRRFQQWLLRRSA